MKNKKYIVGVLLLLAIGFVSFIYFKHISSPKYSIKQIGNSFKNHDITEFNKYVDVKYITNEFLDKYTKDAIDNSTATSDAGRFGESLGRGLVKLMRPKLEEQLSREIQKFVEEGNIKITDDNDKFNYFYLINKILDFKDIKSVEKNGKIAFVIFEFNSTRYDTILSLNVRMRDKGGYWQLFDISDVFKLINTITHLEQIRTAKLNIDLKNKFEKVIEVSEIKTTKKKSDFFKNVFFNEYFLEIKNISGKKIKYESIDFDILDSVGLKVGYLSKNLLRTNILPIEKFTYEINDTFLRYKEYNLKNYSIKINDFNINFDDNSSLSLFDDWDDLDY